MTWISPRGTLDVMDDYNLWVPIAQGYFDALNLDVELVAGPQDATATTKFVAENQADMGYPSPGVLTSSIDSGVPVISIWEQYPAQVFDFSLPEDSPIATVQGPRGKEDLRRLRRLERDHRPFLVEAGVDPKSVSYVESGAQWSQVVSQGQGRRGARVGRPPGAAHRTGSEAEVPARLRLLARPVERVLGQGRRSGGRGDAGRMDTVPAGRGDGIRVRQSQSTGGRPDHVRPAPGSEGHAEPADRARVDAPAGDWLRSERAGGNGWGYHDPAAWDSYLKAVFDLGQTKKQLTADQVYTNDYVEPANSGADVAKAQADAEAFELDADFAETTVPEGTEL